MQLFHHLLVGEQRGQALQLTFLSYLGNWSEIAHVSRLVKGLEISYVRLDPLCIMYRLSSSRSNRRIVSYVTIAATQKTGKKISQLSK